MEFPISFSQVYCKMFIKLVHVMLIFVCFNDEKPLIFFCFCITASLTFFLALGVATLSKRHFENIKSFPSYNKINDIFKK